MNGPTSAGPGIAPGRVLFRGLLLAALCLAAAALLPRPDPAAFAVVAGLGLGALLRWGPAVSPGLAVGALAGALLQSGAGRGPASATAAAVLVGGLLGWAVLASRHLVRFDRRLRGPADVVALAAAGALTAFPLALVTAIAETSASPMASTLLRAWAVVTVAVLLAAVPAASLTPPLASPGSWRWPRIAVLGALAAATLASALPAALGATGPAAPQLQVALGWLPGVGLAALVLTGGIGWASVTLLGVALLLAWTAPTGPAPGLDGVAGWLGALLAGTLLLHAVVQRGRRRERLLRSALAGAAQGFSHWRSVPGGAVAVDVSAPWRMLSGEAGPPRHLVGWLQDVHPDDRPRVADGLAALLDGRSESLRVQLRREVDGRWRWRELSARLAGRDARGQPTDLVATLADSEAEHDALDRQRLSASLFQHLHEGLVITDAELRVLDANPAYCAILGVPLAELAGEVPTILRPSPDPLLRQQRAAMALALRNTGTWRGELTERRRDGEPRTLQLTISTVLGPGGELRYHVLAIADITEQRSQRERLERQAHYDELTRLPNRSRLSQLLEEGMRAADRDGHLLVVCYLDLDRFKPVNDRLGHAAGDRLLAELAGRLRGALRSRGNRSDAAARLGGDEFVLLLRAGTLDEARLAVERVLRVVAQPYLLEGSADPVIVTASMGATVYPGDRSDADTLLRHADHAMYDAKQAGRNGYLFFDPEHRRRTEERMIAIGRVQEALDRGEFVLYYQPKVDMRGGTVLGLEALLRWEHPQQGLVAPLQFLPLIEHTGLSARVGDWVLGQALEHLAQWRRMGLELAVSVNLSARHLQEADFALRLSELLARHPEPLAEHLELEMLETAAHHDIESTSALLARCRALGVRFALDDFGTGYSTLTYLKRLPVDVLKIDRSFVHHMLDDAQDRALVEGVIGLARTFGCTVVAEGVESPAQARALLEMGCSIGQGTGIAAPMPAGQVAEWVRGWRGVFKLTPAADGLPRAAGDAA